MTNLGVRRNLVTVVVATLALVVVSAVPSEAGAAGGGRSPCDDLRLPVRLAPEADTTYEVAATLCGRGPRQGSTVQVLVPGIPFDRSYWDFPQQSRRYSYVRDATRAGYLTLSYDRPGTGASDYPPAEDVTVESNAFVLHQLVQHVRTGELARVGAGAVVSVGFSFGSAVAITEAARYRDVDGVVITGFLHNFGPAIEQFGSIVYPAAEDPAFADRGLPPGYLTTRPGALSAFVNPDNTDPRVIAGAEQLKTTFAPREGDGFVATISDRELSRSIDVPVLTVVGEDDALLCADPVCSAASSEHDAYSPAAQLQVTVVPEAAHALNYHRTAPRVYDVILAWMGLRF
jgi:pimeloyl-ACP methyl ester carboxylesterase